MLSLSVPARKCRGRERDAVQREQGEGEGAEWIVVVVDGMLMTTPCHLCYT